MALKNLKAEIARTKGITQKNVAELLDMTLSNVNKKINESVPFTTDEIKLVRDTFFPGQSLDYLLESDGDVPTEREKDKAQLDAIEDILDEIDACPEFYESLADMRAEHEA